MTEGAGAEAAAAVAAGRIDGAGAGVGDLGGDEDRGACAVEVSLGFPFMKASNLREEEEDEEEEEGVCEGAVCEGAGATLSFSLVGRKSLRYPLRDLYLEIRCPSTGTGTPLAATARMVAEAEAAAADSEALIL